MESVTLPHQIHATSASCDGRDYFTIPFILILLAEGLCAK